MAVHDAVLESRNAQASSALVDHNSIYDMYSFIRSANLELAEHTAGEIRILETQVPRSWSTLMGHMDQARNVGIGDKELDGLYMIRGRCHWLDERKARLRSFRGAPRLFS